MVLSESRAPSSRLALPQVTLCAVTSINIAATIEAMEHSASKIDFGAKILFTDQFCLPGEGVLIFPIEKIESSEQYSRFILKELVHHISTAYCMIVQWDGYPIDHRRWRDEFLQYDYVGARWPQFRDGHDVGNGGFSLRSAQLMKLCNHPDFSAQHPEDVCIGRANRLWLEDRGVRFAPSELADDFAAERAGDLCQAFGYHGVFHMPDVLGPRGFWRLYQALDDRSTLWRDFWPIMRAIVQGAGGLRRAICFARDRLFAT